jgi:DNA-binding response OmpR family regulator
MRVLVIEDHKDILDNLSEYLALKGCEVVAAADGLTGIHMAVTGTYDAIILDVMLPGMDGIEICRRLREDIRDHVPILMLTARDDLDDRLAGFKAGADDYIIKPFALCELFARMETIIQRTSGLRRHVLQVHDLHYDLDSLEVRRAGALLKLNRAHLICLELLMRKSPTVVRHTELEMAIRGGEAAEPGSLRTHIYSLRKVIDKNFEVPLLHTHAGLGYQIQGPD